MDKNNYCYYLCYVFQPHFYIKDTVHELNILFVKKVKRFYRIYGYLYGIRIFFVRSYTLYYYMFTTDRYSDDIFFY